MPPIRVALASLAIGALVSGCSHTPATGTVLVTVILSRDGCPLRHPMCGGGPSFDHVPQRGELVTVTSSIGRRWTGTTDARGTARIGVPAGTYAVDSCNGDTSTAPKTVRVGGTTRLRCDEVAS